MSLHADKIGLSRMILSIENKQLLEKIKNLIKTEESELWDELHDEVKAEVKTAIKELDLIEGTPHDVVMEKYEKKINPV